MNLISSDALKSVIKGYNIRFLIILVCDIFLSLGAAGISAFLFNVLLRRFEVNLNFLDAWSVGFVVIFCITTVKHYRKITYLLLLHNFLQWKYKADASDVLEAICVHGVNLEKGFLTWNNARFYPWLAGERADLQHKMEEHARMQAMYAISSLLSQVFGDSDSPSGNSPRMTAFRGRGDGFRPSDLGERDYDDEFLD